MRGALYHMQAKCNWEENETECALTTIGLYAGWLWALSCGCEGVCCKRESQSSHL